MLTTASLPHKAFRDLHDRLPPDLDNEAVARQTKTSQRSRGVRSGTDLLRRALARARGPSMQHVAISAGQQGITTLTDEAPR